MSQTKKYKFYIVMILMLVSFFMFGCKNETPVEDIYFNLDNGEQIVLIVGQTFEIDDFVVVKPSYATNKKYTITSFNEDVVKVENNKLVALKADKAAIKVTSKDNSRKESMMTVVVKAAREQLPAPLNLKYDNATQSFTFDSVLYASSYTFKINGEEIELGNSNVFSLSQYNGLKYDNLLVAQVRANAPDYSFALQTSNYSSEYKIYQAGEVDDLKINGGVVSFNKSSSNNKHNVYLDDVVLAENLSENYLSLKNLDAQYAGVSASVFVETVVDDEIKQQFGDDVKYCNSLKKSVDLQVLDVPNLTISATRVGWQNIAHSSGYTVLIDGTKIAEIKDNYFDLQSMEGYDNIITANNVHEIKVVPILHDDSIGVGKTIKENLIKVQRLSNPTVVCDGENLAWQDVDNSSLYAISLRGEGVNLKTSTDITTFSMKSYNAGNYVFDIVAVAQVVPSVDNVYYLSSKATTKSFEKHEELTAEIEDYVLKIGNLETGVVKLDFDDDAFDKLITGQGEVNETLSLSDYTFEAGEHSIILTRLGDENHINSNEIEINFVQLEKIDNITISNGFASVVRSETNAQANIILETSGSNLAQPIRAQNTGYQYNTTNPEKENYLPSGAYITKVYVYGDGSSTFSYRESGEVVGHADVDFDVLEIPNSEIKNSSVANLSIESIEKATGYNVYKVEDSTNVFVKQITTNEFNFILNNGTVSYAVQAVGNGSTELPSAISLPVNITRLKTPTLTYDNTSNVISKHDDNNPYVVKGYEFTHNGLSVNYDFVSAFILDETTNIFTLTTLAELENDGDYYLDSASYTLELEKISNSATFEISGLDNRLVIAPTAHSEEFDLEVKFNLLNGIQTFKTTFNEELNKKVLSNGLADEDEIILKYLYEDSKYFVELINENYNAVVEEMNEEFSVQVRFIKPSTGNDSLINSEYVESPNLSLIRIDSASEIAVNAQNQIVLTNSHNQEFALVAVVMTNEYFGYIVESNGEGQLLCNGYILNGVENTIAEPIGLNYEYSYNRAESKSYYYIDIFDENHNVLIPNLDASFIAKVKYSFLHNGIETDLDSYYCEEKTIAVQPKSSIVRDGQYLKITNVKDTYTYLNYSLLVNNYILPLNNTAVSEGDYIVVDVEFIYSNTPSNYIQEINLIEVLVNNIETTDENPILASKSDGVLISKTQSVVIANYKFNNNEDGNNNNSTVVYFDAYKTSYEKSYVVEFYHDGNKVYPMVCSDLDATAGEISFNLDDIDQLSSITGLISIVVNVQTTGTKTHDEKLVQVFNSNVSNTLMIEKISAPENINISDSTITFDSVPNAVGYEIWEVTGTGKTKLNTALITNNYYEISNLSGQKQIVVKAISDTDNYTNSYYGEMVTIYKLDKPEVSVENGKVNVKLSLSLLQLMANENIEIVPEISNSSTDKVTIDLDSLDGRDVQMLGLNLIVEPYLFLSYNSQSLTSERCTLKYRIYQTDEVEGIYYLNSDSIEIDCYGLFEPLNVKKSTSDNNSVEMISWTSNSKNVLNSEALSVGYVFKIQYTQGENTYVYYSNDTNLKYYDKATASYVSYPTYISTTSAIFPAGYGVTEGGELQVKFGAGTYKISVQSVPLSSISGVNLCSSKFTQACEFEIMEAAQLSVEEGSVVWDANPKADYYTVSIYQEGVSTPFFTDTTTSNVYDFSNSNLNNLTGVYKVLVKAISTRDDTLNSADSEDYYIYRLPQADEVYIDDGYLILGATYFFSGAIVEFVDTVTNSKYVRLLDNSETATYIIGYMMTEYNITDWENFSYSFVFNQVGLYAISLNSLNILDGRDYQINIKLIGNTHASLGIISSAKTMSLSNMTATKLKANTIDVNLGVVQFMPDSDYATISKEGVYTPLIEANYSFNGATSSDFWLDTSIYKINVTTNTGIIPIYAVDYYSFKTAIENGTLASTDYELLSGAYGLYACVKYAYDDGGTTKYLLFNVYENNMINLRDYDALYYYPMTESMEEGGNKFACGETYQTINLAEGGSFGLEVFMLGGDSYRKNTNTCGYLTSQANVVKTFIRYGVNQLTTFEGQVQFKNTIPCDDEGVVIDYPVYKLVVTALNSNNGQVVYIYHTTEEYAREVAQRHDAENYENAIYIQANINDENDTILFDLSQYFKAGTYRVSIRTLAGLGSGETEEQDYLLNAQEPTIEYTFQKLSDTQFVSNAGVLEFNQSYIVRDGKNIYFNSYEITLKDLDTDTNYVYNINDTTEGVTINETTHKVRYVIPKVMNLVTDQGEVNLITDGGKTYSIKVRANSTDNYILNGTYKKEDNDDYMFNFEKSLGLSESAKDKLRIENGMLKWKVLDLDNFVNTVIKVSFLDENLQTKNILINVNDLNRYEKDGVYQYHYYQFVDEKYNLESSGSAYITDKIIRNYAGGAQEEVVVYTITAYTVGKTVGQRNIINSNLCSQTTTTRLSMVDTATIKTVDGILLWNAVDNASSYEVILNGNERYTFTTSNTYLNFLDEDKLLEVGNYNIQIKAIGNSLISSMLTSADNATGFIQLDKVDLSSVEIIDNKIVWAAVENADAYKVVFEYNDLTGANQTIVDDEIYETYFTTPSGISGIFKITISAISKDQGKEFNSQSIEFTSSSDAPMQVENFEFDEVSSKLIIDVKKSNFLSGDKLLIAYNFAKYVSNGIDSAIFLTETISYQQTGTFVELDEETVRYYYPLTIMGQYSNISVQVTRPGTVPSNAVQITDIDLNLFSYGAGIEENPYRIYNAEHLLNIKYFPSAHYVLTSSINMSSVNVEERLQSYGAIISDEFSGVLNGATFSIFGFNIDESAKTDTINLTDVENFALFGTLNNATIENLSIGTENIQLILINTFANSKENMINLSLIATGANNSIIKNVDVVDFKMQLNSNNQSQLLDEVYVAGLIANATNTTITNSTINVSVDMNIGFTGSIYVGGAIAKATTSDIVETSINFNFASANNDTVLYVGGAVAYYVGGVARTNGITSTDVAINISNVKAIYLGGLVGFARYININNVSTQGTYTKTNINYQMFVGGLVGTAQSSIIKNSGSKVAFNVSVSSTQDKYIGAIAGNLTVVNSISGLVENCYMNTTYQAETSVTTSLITLGIYGYKDPAVTITGCYKLEN